MNILTGIKVLEEKESKFNGKVSVIKSLAWGTYLQVDGLTQSGGVVKDIWKTTLKKVQSAKRKVRSCLILGLGGGSVAELVRKFWPDSKITGVDIDPIIIELGIKYLELSKSKIDIKIGDAQAISRQLSAIGKKYDLIIVDLYQGRDYPEKFASDEFPKLILKLLSPDGMAIFNRLYYDEKRREAMKLGEKLQKIFSNVEYFYPQANVMFLCSN